MAINVFVSQNHHGVWAMNNIISWESVHGIDRWARTCDIQARNGIQLDTSRRCCGQNELLRPLTAS